MIVKTIPRQGVMIAAHDARECLGLMRQCEQPFAMRERNVAVTIAMRDENRRTHIRDVISRPKLIGH